MKTVIGYLLFMATIVNTMIVWAGAPIVALDLVSKSIMKENRVILAVFILGLVIWLFGTGWWGMQKIGETYRNLPRKKSPSQ